MPRITHHYDLVVVGRSLAGLAAAALVARRGKRVLVLPGGPVEGCVPVGPMEVSLDVAPAVWIDSPPVRTVLRELGLTPQIGRSVRRARGVFQWVDGTARTTWTDDAPPPFAPADPQATADPDTPPPWEALAEAAAAERTDPFAGRRAAERLARLARSQAATGDEATDSYVAAAAPFVTDVAPDHLPPAVRSGVAAGLLPAPLDLDGGLARLRRDLLKMLDLHGGEVRPDLRVEAFSLRRGRIDGVALSGRADRLGTEHLAVADEDLAREGIAELPIVAGDRVLPWARRFTLRIDVAPTGVGPGPGDFLVLRAPLFGAPGRTGGAIVRIERPAGAPVRVEVGVLVAPGTPRGTLREAILDWLDAEAVLPFVHDHVVACASAHDGRPPTGGDGRPLDDLAAATLGRPAPMDPVLEPAAALAGGVALVPTRTAIRNLHLCCALSHPALGLAGAFATALRVAGTIAPPARSPLARRPLLRRP